MSRLLIVSADTQEVEAWSSDLRAIGADVAIAVDADDATAVVKDADLVILDNALPAMDGFELCKRLRKEAGTGRAAIFILGKAVEMSGGWERRARDAGATGSIAKPFSVTKLRTVLATLDPSTPPFIVEMSARPPRSNPEHADARSVSGRGVHVVEPSQEVSADMDEKQKHAGQVLLLSDIDLKDPDEVERWDRAALEGARERIAADRQRMIALGIIDENGKLLIDELPPDMRADSETDV